MKGVFFRRRGEWTADVFLLRVSFCERREPEEYGVGVGALFPLVKERREEKAKKGAYITWGLFLFWEFLEGRAKCSQGRMHSNWKETGEIFLLFCVLFPSFFCRWGGEKKGD